MALLLHCTAWVGLGGSRWVLVEMIKGCIRHGGAVESEEGN